MSSNQLGTKGSAPSSRRCPADDVQTSLRLWRGRRGRSRHRVRPSNAGSSRARLRGGWPSDEPRLLADPALAPTRRLGCRGRTALRLGQVASLLQDISPGGLTWINVPYRLKLIYFGLAALFARLMRNGGHNDVRSSGGIWDRDLHSYCGADPPVFNAASAGGRAIEPPSYARWRAAPSEPAFWIGSTPDDQDHSRPCDGERYGCRGLCFSADRSAPVRRPSR